MTEFADLWSSEYALSFEEFIEQYSLRYEVIRKQRKIAKSAEVPSIDQYRLQPNSMQLGFISNLQKIKESGEEKALLISATGTGKTYASAFALREQNVKKTLFLVHREQIAKQAITSYKKVFGNTRTFGLLSGNSKDYEADYLFATMQMMSKQEVLSRFRKDEFQTIVIDEAINEIKQEQGKNFSLAKINLAELERRTGLSRSRLRRLKENNFIVTAHGRTGQKATATILTGYSGIY